MARIRTIKPDFFKHEQLFDAEKTENLPLRVAFSGLWCVADREGRFRWRPRAIKLDVLPYDDIDFAEVMAALERHGFIRKYECDGELYGYIPSWHRHQSINQREAKSDIPTPEHRTHVHADALQFNARGEGKGRERKGKDISDATHPHPPGGGTADADIPALMIEIWQQELGNVLPKPRKIDKTRQQKLSARFRDTFGESLDAWRQCCQRIRGSPLLTGDNDRGWRADIDFCLEPRKLNRILEGFYDRKQTGNGHARPNHDRETNEQRAERLAQRHASRVLGPDQTDF